MNDILEYLEASARRFPAKTALADATTARTFAELLTNSRHIGSALAERIPPVRPVIVSSEKNVLALEAFMGIVQAGCFYVFVSPAQSDMRVRQILDVTRASLIISTGEDTRDYPSLGFKGEILRLDEALKHPIMPERLASIRSGMCDTDPLYCNFTSGSTGVPKGVLVCHRSVIDFIDRFTVLFGIGENDVIGNQAPFDFDVSVKDIYSSLKTGATLQVIPMSCFSSPMALMDFLCDRHVTTLIWAVSALCLMTRLHGMSYRVPRDVNKILFSGEVMPVKHLNLLKASLPEARYVNLYGPTEITCNCTYHEITREYREDERIPIGKPFPNKRVFLLDQENREVTTPHAIGEICVSGTALALGYYNDPLQTAKSFVQNPLNSSFPETIYRTGDLAFLDQDGDYCFAGRRDFQIKYMGHRIELEEIELLITRQAGVERAACVFDEDKNKIIAFYSGDTDERTLRIALLAEAEPWMVPSVFIKKTELPLTANGKTDKKTLLKNYKETRAC